MDKIHGYNKRLCVSDKVYEKFMVEAVREHLKFNPDKAGRKITQNEIANIVVDFYLRAKVW